MTATTIIRIVFMGTPDFAVHMLKGIIKNGYNAAESEMEKLLIQLDSITEKSVEVPKETFWSKLKKRLSS